MIWADKEDTIRKGQQPLSFSMSWAARQKVPPVFFEHCILSFFAVSVWVIAFETAESIDFIGVLWYS